MASDGNIKIEGTLQIVHVILLNDHKQAIKPFDVILK